MRCAQCGKPLHVVETKPWRDETLRRRRCLDGHIQWTRESRIPRPPAAFAADQADRLKTLKRDRA